ncbi:hypothetical protein ACFOSC_17460 [Streptantibioticus rubrisoli]|uniref:Uncharacterized protein n=1 Tax=Streptantibioticus rubrisoli TaxID=1387313 RepID=A0ABT1PHM9_9ACTN|nr:hypothetical protein [Streptantibioticus rubrisoli]MCQ4044855.1 hypothetical protein [Streptantibioticus rubrisoli]
MLEETLTALAMAGGTAVVKAAGTDAWNGFRQRIAGWFGRGDVQREHAELERLDQTASVLEAAGPGEVERVRIRQEAAWQTRFEALLESLDEHERSQVADQLRVLLKEQASVSAGAGGLAAGGNVDIHAEQGSIAAAVIHGGASISNPPKPDLSQG